MRVSRRSAMCLWLPRPAGYDLGQVGDGRLGVQPGEHVVAARVLGERGDARGLVVEVAEHDRFRRTRLGAGWRDVAVLDRAVLETRPVLRPADPLHAEGAF